MNRAPGTGLSKDCRLKGTKPTEAKQIKGVGTMLHQEKAYFSYLRFDLQFLSFLFISGFVATSWYFYIHTIYMGMLIAGGRGVEGLHDN